MPSTTDSLVSEILGLFPMGLYLMTAAHDTQRAGMLVHSVQRCCDSPALLCVAARKGHAIDPLIRDSRSFAIGIVSAEDKIISRRFSFDETTVSTIIEPIADDPFEAIPTKTLVTGSPMLTRCPIWFDCEVSRRIDLESNYELFVGRVLAVMHHGERIDIDQEPIEDNE
ncbi:MAG: flavin reductase [Phycisphaerales bacterium]|nr:flavin reductase [Phycisphaerales bacterium]